MDHEGGDSPSQGKKDEVLNLRLQGLPYVKLRENGEKYQFFCILCLESYPCREASLMEHLNDTVHKTRLAAAKITLLKSNPWPFNDGVHFFPISSDFHFDSSPRNTNGKLVVPGVLWKNEIFDLEVRFIGIGRIAARFFVDDRNRQSKIWCEWLGMDSDDMDTSIVPGHEFAVVNFVYHHNLGRKGFPHAEIEDVEHARKKRSQSSSDPEDISQCFRKQFDSSGQDYPSSNSSSSRMLLDGYDDQLLHSKVMSRKTNRRGLRQQKHVAAERMCHICAHKILPGKDVAILLNMKTRRLVCSSRNRNGMFHLFHTSCLVHWILLCEPKIYEGKKLHHLEDLVVGAKSIFCPECQGTGINIDGDELEQPTVNDFEMTWYKMNRGYAYKAWMENPEETKNCSIGLHFSSKSDELVQENVSQLKLVHFYRADE